MAGQKRKPQKRRIEAGGRVTPKGGPAKTRRSGSEDAPEFGSTRYTPPTAAAAAMPSPTWVPVLMFGLFIAGVLTIFLNYVSVLPGAVSNAYLLVGLAFILGGIITATQYR